MTDEKEEMGFGQSGTEIFETLRAGLKMAQGEEAKVQLNTFAHIQMLWLHARALAAHCECLGMNAENMWAAIANASPVYKSEHYYEILQKWGLIR